MIENVMGHRRWKNMVDVQEGSECRNRGRYVLIIARYYLEHLSCNERWIIPHEVYNEVAGKTGDDEILV